MARDTGEDIARFFGVTMDELERWNDITPQAKLPSNLMIQLFVPDGTDLARAIVWTPDEVTELVVGTEAFFDFHEAQRDRKRIRYRTHIVKQGDSLRKIARRYGISVQSLTNANRVDPRRLKVGSRLRIPRR